MRVRNTGARPGREVVQVYVAPLAPAGIERPARQLAGFASAEAEPGETAEVMVQLPERAFQIWDDAAGCWAVAGGEYSVEAGRSVTDRRVGTRTTV